MDNDTLSLYESLVSFDTPRELRKAYRSLMEAGEDGLLSDGYYALKRPYKDVNAEVRALRRAKKKHLGEALAIFQKSLDTLSEDDLAAGFVYLEIVNALAIGYLRLGEKDKAKKELLSAVDMTDGLATRASEALGAIYLAEGDAKAFRALKKRSPEAHGLKVLSDLAAFMKDGDAAKLRKKLVKDNFYAYLTAFGVCQFQEGLLAYADRNDDGSEKSLSEATRLFAYLRTAGFDLNGLFLKIQAAAPKERERFLMDKTNEAALTFLGTRFRLGKGNYVKKKEAVAFLMEREGLDETRAKKVVRAFIRSGILHLKHGYLLPTPGAFALYIVP